jgi:sulfate transport system ATP-binding protein
MSIEARNITKTFGGRSVVLRDVSITVNAGELVALLGPSGCGKTTLLRVIAGLEQPDPGSGPILFHDADVAGTHPRERQVGFVFQHYALFRHMTVFENVAFGLRVKPRDVRPPEATITSRVMDLLRLVQLDAIAHRHPNQLSGGQRQRVALARALAVEPRVLLLDEPFGALDAKVRKELRGWLRRLHDEIHVTSVFVTHDQEEAMEVADRIVLMNQGRVVQTGTPDEVFNSPATEFVMEFLGQVNLFHGRIEGGRFKTAGWAVPAGASPPREGTPVRLYVRPHDVDVASQSQGDTSIMARVAHVWSAGPTVKLELTARSGETIHAEMPHDRFRALGIKKGDDVFANPRSTRLFLHENDG